MNIKFMAIGTLGWIIFLAFVILWYWAELSTLDRFFIIGGEIVFLIALGFLGFKIYKSREIL